MTTRLATIEIIIRFNGKNYQIGTGEIGLAGDKDQQVADLLQEASNYVRSGEYLKEVVGE